MAKKKQTKKQAGLVLDFATIKLIRSWIDVPLHGEQVRVRNKIYQIFNPIFLESEQKRMDILDSYVDKDENGTKKLDEQGLFLITEERKKEFNDKMIEMYMEEREIPIDKKLTNVLIDILLHKVMKQFTIQDGAVYDEVISKLENYARV